MDTNVRLTQFWSLLVNSALAEKVLTYATIEQLIGVPKQVIGCFIKPIHDYCNFRNLPPLTALVVSETDDPLSGKFTEAGDIFGERARVYMFDWISLKPPSPEDFKKATENESNEIPWHGIIQPPSSLWQTTHSDRVWDN
jgi:hypothetical protein